MASETTKAWIRRLEEDETTKNNFWKSIFSGKGIDIGCGMDKLPLEQCQPFDLQHGDANRIDELLPANSFDYVHASQCLEHMNNPADALARWMKIVKPNGHAIITIPDFDLYEKRVWPSRYNSDHKAAFSLERESYPNVPQFYNVPKMLKDYNVVLCRLVTKNYDFNLPDHVDQTRFDWVECFIEFVLKK